MELDDFRRKWQQTAGAALPATPDLDAAHLQTLLRKRPGLVEQMRRNACRELVLTTVLILIFSLRLVNPDSLLIIMQGALLLLMGAGQLYYYYYKLGVLRRMATVEGNVQYHLRHMCHELRRLLRFFYRVTLVTGPFVLLMWFCYDFGRELVRPTGADWVHLGRLAAILTGSGLLLQLLVIRLTRWHLQRLYGRHLDQLEAALRELETPE
jgi:hypothetical protein